jgi:tetratricopeptide (TPR) repeat protein
MKYILVLFCLIITYSIGNAQQQTGTAKQLQESAKSLLQQGQFDKAVQVLDIARQQEPGNIEILKDLVFANYLKRDFAKAIEIGKVVIELPEADQQAFQVLGLAYKAIASYKEGGRLYKTALKKFPNSGVIYNEYAELLAMDNSLEDAIAQWEKGIELDPNYSGSYYNAAMYYIRYKSWLRAVLYAEQFLNLESYSARTEEIKKQLPDIYKNLLTPAVATQLLNAKTTTPFEKAVLESLVKAADGTQVNNAADLIGIRTRFIKDWAQDKQKKYPFQLFDNEQYLLSQGLFEAYNYWLFSPVIGEDVYKIWLAKNAKEGGAFKNLQQNKLFKVPAGQYYFAR